MSDNYTKYTETELDTNAVIDTEKSNKKADTNINNKIVECQ